MPTESPPNTLPPEHIPILIIGAGPVGLSLAIELRLFDIKVLVVDREAEIINSHPKGRANDLRTLEHYRRWGVSDELHRLAWKTRNPNQKVVITNSIVEPPLGAYPLRLGRHVDESRDYAAEPSLSVPQAITMRVLQKKAVELGAIVLRGWEAKSIHQQDDEEKSVTTRLRSPTGIIFSISSEYVVGCDGPDSLVRTTAGISRRGIGPTSRSVSYVVRSEGYKIGDLISSPAHDSLGFLMVLSSKASTIVSIPDDEHWGLSFEIPDDAPNPTDEEIQRHGRDVLGVDTPLSIVSSSSYRVFTRVALSYRKDRLFIAGDAAHLCPPTGGHNMNVGIGDAVNLAWKIAGVVQGWGGEKLLQSYDIERRSVGNLVTDAAFDNHSAMEKATEIFRNLPSLDPNASSEQRFNRGDIAYQITYPQWNSFGVVLGQRYEESSLTIRGEWTAPPYSGSEYWPHASPGHRAPHVWLDDKSPLLDHFEKYFTLLDIEASDGQVTRFLKAAADVGLPITHLKVSAAVARKRYPAEITIIRPDQYISWQGNECSNPASVIDTIRGF
ncbi:hypothetical protein PV10_04434 [Exophiala mesophila]|uniref:FAD-binding domain-containing protein n=1 Tax=Exophiala mesophila TaxID=212818 RepID=A0A0D1ZHA8_EXOME|nr:uncharacterized protein PV10_04434 [Exophiala mesophila]KIV93199.1 hypothetical protein PV10_04434 [Exophiala mesophila]